MQLLPEIEAIPASELRSYIKARADMIVERTQGESWDDPEEWSSEAVELAHAVARLLRGGDIAETSLALTPERLAEIKARANAATAGPWLLSTEDAGDDTQLIWISAPGADNMFDFQDGTIADARFLSHARQDVPDLVAEVERLRNA